MTQLGCGVAKGVRNGSVEGCGVAQLKGAALLS